MVKNVERYKFVIMGIKDVFGSMVIEETPYRLAGLVKKSLADGRGLLG